ncbi:MAG: carbohydrate ABC transporter permease, partial [Oscillospiraceae bacterium]
MKKIKLGKISSHFFLIIVSITIIIPLVYLVSISFSDEADIIHNGYPLIPRVFSTVAYQQAFAVPELIGRAYGVTIFVTVVGTVMSLLMTAGIAYVASRRDYKFRKITSLFLLIPLLFNGGMVSQYIINTQIFHLDDTI